MKKILVVLGASILLVVGSMVAMEEPTTPFPRSLADGGQSGSLFSLAGSREDLEQSLAQPTTPSGRLGVALPVLDTSSNPIAKPGPRTIAKKAEQLRQPSAFRRYGIQVLFTGIGAFAVDKLVKKFTLNPFIRMASDVGGATLGYSMSLLWLRYGPKKNITPKRRVVTARF